MHTGTNKAAPSQVYGSDPDEYWRRLAESSANASQGGLRTMPAVATSASGASLASAMPMPVTPPPPPLTATAPVSVAGNMASGGPAPPLYKNGKHLPFRMFPHDATEKSIVAACKRFPVGVDCAFVQNEMAQVKFFTIKGTIPEVVYAVHVSPLPTQGNGKGCVTFYLKGKKAVIDGGGGAPQQAGELSRLIQAWTSAVTQ